MHFLKKVLTILTLGFCTLSVQASPFSISEQQINQYLSEKGTINDKLGIPGLFSVDYALKDLVMLSAYKIALPFKFLAVRPMV